LIWLNPSTQSYGPWWVMHYTYRAIIVSTLLLCNNWLDFHKNLMKLSIPRGDAYIITMFRSDHSTQSNGPLLVCAVCI
jgi:hypothetical protein